MTAAEMLRAIHFIPILTTIIAAVFAYKILSRWAAKPGSYYLLWWGLGVAVYGVGTLVEGLVAVFGWHVVFFKSWYIAGALLGGAPLAIGTIYLLMGKRAGHIAVTLLTATVAITSVFVLLSPVNYELVTDGALTSAVLEWQDIRMVSPFINGLAAIFLIGGAILSAIRYARKRETKNRSIGNWLIAIGAMLPGIGGAYSRMGHTEVLYVGEFLGIILIWWGYKYCQRPVEELSSRPQTAEAAVSS